MGKKTQLWENEKRPPASHLALLHDVEKAHYVHVALGGALDPELGRVLDLFLDRAQGDGDGAVRGDVHDLRGGAETDARESCVRGAVRPNEARQPRLARAPRRTLSATRMPMA